MQQVVGLSLAFSWQLPFIPIFHYVVCGERAIFHFRSEKLLYSHPIHLPRLLSHDSEWNAAGPLEVKLNNHCGYVGAQKPKKSIELQIQFQYTYLIDLFPQKRQSYWLDTYCIYNFMYKSIIYYHNWYYMKWKITQNKLLRLVSYLLVNSSMWQLVYVYELHALSPYNRLNDSYNTLQLLHHVTLHLNAHPFPFNILAKKIGMVYNSLKLIINLALGRSCLCWNGLSVKMKSQGCPCLKWENDGEIDNIDTRVPLPVGDNNFQTIALHSSWFRPSHSGFIIFCSAWFPDMLQTHVKGVRFIILLLCEICSTVKWGPYIQAFFSQVLKKKSKK